MRVSRRVFGLCLILLMLFTTLAGATEGLSGNDVASTVEPLLEPDFWGFEWGSPIAEVDEILGKAADTTVQEGGIVRQIRLVRVFGKLALLQLRFSSEGTLYGGVMQPILSPEEVSDYQDELYNRLVEKYSNPAELELDEPEFGYGWGKNSTYINYLYSLEEGVDEHPDSLSTLLVYVDGNHPHDFIDFVEWFGGTPPEEAALTPEPLKDKTSFLTMPEQKSSRN